MTFTYSDAEATTRDKLRGKIGDINTKRQMLSNEILDNVLGDFANNLALSAIEGIKRILARLARDVDRSGLGITSNRSQQILHYQDLLGEMKREGIVGSTMFVGGISVADKVSFDEDSDLVQPQIRRGQDDNPGVADPFGRDRTS